MAKGDGSIATTPTWAVAAVCSVLILAALLAEHALHLLTALLKRRRRKTLNQALYHVKAELRSFGFMSLILNVAQQPISKICISETLAGTFLPCKEDDIPGFSSGDDSCPKACFFRQFKTSVSKADYLALRHGFITGYFPQDQSYDFHKFLRRSLDQEFSMVVEISHWSWTYAVLFIFFNAQGFYSYFWLPVIPLVVRQPPNTIFNGSLAKVR
ncbi:hypothetical protein Taro_056172 [Colocasia esculenta]|uniref:MLO-like protein n=1 Tax=Colocasia esculenta TaxID=4460 RepID=A0A843XVQ2_COLES|nr:hypothetical protein [Colocasia esculenta]